MKNLLIQLMLLLLSASAFSQAAQVTISKSADGDKLVVNGKDFMINGMNWDYIPIGTNTVNAEFWKKSDDIIKAGLHTEMTLLRNMNVNVIRQYTGVPARWIQYIYETYGIYTMLNHSFGRYGLTLDGVWTPVTDYSDPKTQAFLMSEIDELVSGYKDTPGLLMYLLGNENNYGLFWQGAETEDFPDDEAEKQFIGESRGRPMYKLMNDAAVKMKAMDSSHPVAICNGDVLFIDIIAEECKDVDIYGTNTYRGVSFGDMFQVVKEKLDMPLMFTEFGADAFNAITNTEDQAAQAYYMVGNWKEIYENAAGLGKVGNSIGGFTFQFSDGWWKFGFDDRENADVHDNNASWANGGYSLDLAPGENNMNEEWFGICAKGQTNEMGLYELYPRAAYYALQQAHGVDPYAEGQTAGNIQYKFSNIQVVDAELRARGDKAALEVEQIKKIRFSGFRADINTYNTNGALTSTPNDPDPEKLQFPNQTGFDHMESYYLGFEASPTANIKANVSFNMIGHVAQNPIDEIFYENRGRPRIVKSDQGDFTLQNINRFQVYQADFEWKGNQFDLNGFYRTGHYHWGYEGDFFGLYPEANYGPNIDIYNGEAPFGFEITGKKEFEGFKAAFGPELWWGANAAVLLKYNMHIGGVEVSGIFHEDIDEQGIASSSFAIPLPVNRRASLYLKKELGDWDIELGGIWAGDKLVGRKFQVADSELETATTYEDEITPADTWGGKIKFTYQGGAFNWYAQAAAMGLVARGGADYTRTFTGWRLKDSGSDNQYNFLTGFTFNLGDLQVAPNFLWQKPVVGPMPNGLQSPGRLRNVFNDPFAVRANRETVAGEILFTYDPTPGTWMYEWDNDMAEDAKFAISTGFVYRKHETSMDAAIGILGDGRTFFPFDGSPPAEDLWEAHARIVSKINPDFGLISNLLVGNAQSNGSDSRMLERFVGDLRLIYKKVKFTGMVKVDDWGPFDYHRDFNLTYPLQLMADVSTTLSKPGWFNLPNTRAGIRYTWRDLDQYSPRYCPAFTTDSSGASVCDPNALAGKGKEWEIRTYFQINIGR